MMITPREMLRDYMTVLNILMQNPDKSFADIASAVTLSHADAPASGGGSEPALVAPEAGKRADFDPADIVF